MGACLSELKRNGEAISAYKQALSLDPNDAHALLRLGACYYHAGAYREAVAPLERYVAAKPKDFYGFYYLGHSHFELRQFAQAARALHAAHELNPDDVMTRLGLFGSYLATGQIEKACGLYPFLFPAGGSLLVLRLRGRAGMDAGVKLQAARKRGAAGDRHLAGERLSPATAAR